MAHSLKTLGLALVAALALGAFAAAAASAVEFHSEREKTILTGEQIETGTEPTEFKFGTNGSVICQTHTLTGTTPQKTTKSVTMTPVYDKCAFGTATPKVFVNNCDYLYTFDKKVNEDNTMHIGCPVGQVIAIETVIGASKCLVTIAGQTASGGVTYTNKNKGSGTGDFNITSTLELKYTVEGGFGCALFFAGKLEYKGVSTIKGYEDPEVLQTEVWVE